MYVVTDGEGVTACRFRGVGVVGVLMVAVAKEQLLCVENVIF